MSLPVLVAWITGIEDINLFSVFDVTGLFPTTLIVQASIEDEH